MTEKKSRVSKAQWLDMALEVFEKEGVNSIKIEQLARALGVAKSGFYWHFKNRRDLLEEMLKYWEDEYTTTVTHYFDSIVDKIAPDEMLLTIMQFVRKNRLNGYDLAIRSWAETDEMARNYTQRAYQIRYDLLKSIFKSMGYKGNDLENRTRMFVVYESWNPFVFSQDSNKKLTALEKQRLKIYTS